MLNESKGRHTLSKLRHSIPASGSVATVTASEHKFGPMELVMREIGKIIDNMATESSLM